MAAAAPRGFANKRATKSAWTPGVALNARLTLVGKLKGERYAPSISDRYILAVGRME